LTWVCPFTQAQGTLKFGKNNQIEMRSPFEIGNELSLYISSRQKVPFGIEENKHNNLEFWLNKL
jgi:hypothetical protein